MHWIEKFRRKNQLSQRDFASLAGCSAALIDILENMNRPRTHPNIANRIAEICGATQLPGSGIPLWRQSTGAPGSPAARARL